MEVAWREKSRGLISTRMDGAVPLRWNKWARRMDKQRWAGPRGVLGFGSVPSTLETRCGFFPTIFAFLRVNLCAARVRLRRDLQGSSRGPLGFGRESNTLINATRRAKMGYQGLLRGLGCPETSLPGSDRKRNTASHRILTCTSNWDHRLPENPPRQRSLLEGQAATTCVKEYSDAQREPFGLPDHAALSSHTAKQVALMLSDQTRPHG